MTKRKVLRPDPTRAGRKTHAKGMPSFQEIEKKFKPGPVAPPESPSARPDMGGGPSTTATGALTKQIINDQAHGHMSDGKPGQIKKMPGE